MWNNVVQFLRTLGFLASHLLLFMSREAWAERTRRPALSSAFPCGPDVIKELSRHLPAGCVISGGVAQNGLIGTSTDLASTRVSEGTELAVTILAFGTHAPVRLSPAGIIDGQLTVLKPSSDPGPVGEKEEEEDMKEEEEEEEEEEEDEGGLTVCLGTTPGGIAGFLGQKNPYPTFFLGLRPAVQGFSFMEGAFDTRSLLSLQCVLLRGPDLDQTLLSASTISCRAHLPHVRQTYQTAAGKLLNDGCKPRMALQLVTYSTRGFRSYRHFRRLLRDCCSSFRQCFSRIPLTGVLVRASDSQRHLAQCLLLQSQCSLLERFKKVVGGCGGAAAEKDAAGHTADHQGVDFTDDDSFDDSGATSYDVNEFEKRLNKLARDFHTPVTSFDPECDPYWDVGDAMNDYSEEEDDLEEQLQLHELLEASSLEERDDGYENDDLQTGEDDGDADIGQGKKDQHQSIADESVPRTSQCEDCQVAVSPQEPVQEAAGSSVTGKASVSETASRSEAPPHLQETTTAVRFDRAVRYHKEPPSVVRVDSFVKTQPEERNNHKDEEPDSHTRLHHLSNNAGDPEAGNGVSSSDSKHQLPESPEDQAGQESVGDVSDPLCFDFTTSAEEEEEEEEDGGKSEATDYSDASDYYWTEEEGGEGDDGTEKDEEEEEEEDGDCRFDILTLLVYEKGT
ncbi:hypothetical protein ACOMHN_024778 [Nucella lapillus]